MNRQAVLDRLRSEMDDISRQFGVKDLALFGSMARDEATEQSDLDLLVTFEGRSDFDRFMDLKFHLENWFIGRSTW
jgi:predicted nucleotidyltransferase